MQRIIVFVKRFLHDSLLPAKRQFLTPKQQLGRWNVEYCERMTRKIDWANHDNCGPCVITTNIQASKTYINATK